MVGPLLAVLLCAGVSAAPASRPNVIILLSDDQGYGDLSCTGNPLLKTPNLDRLHDEAVRFTDFHVSPMCTPTRGQLMSGMDALHNGATSVTAGRALLRKGIPTMADVFAAGGYRTGLFGKWHLGDDYPYRPMDRGFQESVYFFGYGFTSAPEFDNDYFDSRYQHNGQLAGRYTGYCTDFWFNEAMAWMKQQKAQNQPFFCYLPTNVPHGPAWVDPKYSQIFAGHKGAPAAFFGMIVNLDENLGRLEQFLKNNGLRDDTLLVFMTDNGGTGGVNFYNAGMRGRKTQYWEGGHRVPCFVRWPGGNLRPPTDVTPPAEIQDLMPTLTELCDLKRPQNATWDGVSLAGVLRDPNAALADRTLVVQYGQTLKKGDACVIRNQWRLVLGKELYDLKADPGQKNDIAAQRPDMVAKLSKDYDAWWDKLAPTLNDFAPITIGSDKANLVALSSSDWQDIYCDNSTDVHEGKGGPQGGPWNVLVDQDGVYEIALRRYPQWINVPLTASLPEQKTAVASYPPGKAFPIAKACLTVGNQNLNVPVSSEDHAAVFHVKLMQGDKTQLRGWFQDADGKDLCGAYYAYVRRE